MSLQDPFGFGLPKPWLQASGTHDKEPGEEVQVGLTNDLSQDSAAPNFTTIVVNKAPQSAAFAGHNNSGGEGAVGVVGVSNGRQGGVGVTGTSPFLGVSGVVTREAVGIVSNPNDTDPFPDRVGVFGAGDRMGVYGQSGVKHIGGIVPLDLPNLPNQPPPRFGVVGFSDTNAGVFGNGAATGVIGTSEDGRGVKGSSHLGVGVFGSQTQDTGAAPDPSDPKFASTGVVGIGELRGGIFQPFPLNTERIPLTTETQVANIQLTPVGSLQSSSSLAFTQNPNAPSLPVEGQAGDMIAVQLLSGSPKLPNLGVSNVQLWLCIKTGIASDNPAAAATWARVALDRFVGGMPLGM